MLPMTKASFNCPSLLYQGGLPAVYRVLLPCVCKTLVSSGLADPGGARRFFREGPTLEGLFGVFKGERAVGLVRP